MATTIDDLPGPRRLPGLGNAHQLKTRSLHLILERWARQYGPLYRIDMGPVPVLVISDRDAANAMLRERPDGYRRWVAISEVLLEMGIDGVFGAEGAAWRRQRRLSVTALNADYLNRYYDVIARSVGRLHRRLQAAAAGGGPLNIHAAFQAFTVDVTTGLAFGQDVRGVDGGDGGDADLLRNIACIFDGLARRLNAPVPYWRTVRLPADRALERSMAAVNAAVGPLIAEARRRMAADPGRVPANFLEGMLAAPDRFSDSEITGNAITMLLAGEDTTAHSLAWAAWYVAKRPDVQERLRAEALEVLTGPVPDYAATTRLTYADAVVREAVRMRSAAAVIFLEPCEDARVLDVAVPAGTRLIVLTRHIAVQDGTFARAKSFDPDRWLTGAADPKGNLAFGSGPRVCPGRNLAYLEAKSALAMLAYGFELAPDATAARPRERFGFTTAPDAVPVLLRERAARSDEVPPVPVDPAA